MVPPDDHDCGWKQYALELQAKSEALEKLVAQVVEKQKEQEAELLAIKKRRFGKSSEKMPPMAREVRRATGVDSAQAQLTRKANAELRAKKIETAVVDVPVPEAARHCPKCTGTNFSELGDGKPSSIIEYVPGYFRKRIFRRQKLSCSCGQFVITAPVPEKVFDKTQYGPGFMAHLVVSKCCDSLPFYRLEKQFNRLGIPMSRSTMTALFHRVGEVLTPIADRILDLIAASDIVLADETPERMQSSAKKAYIWTFVAEKLIAYRFSTNRSGDTPKHVLGGTKGTLVVDMYTGYNVITGVGGRERAGCLAHVRRKFWDALDGAPEAQFVLDTIRDIYVLESQIKGAAGYDPAQHSLLRWQQTLPLLDKLYVWLAAQQSVHRPKSPMGKAINYTLKNWQALTRFIRDTRLPPDNNRSEAALRVVALGRKNFLFVGHEDAGYNLAALYSVVATCEANRVDPLAYLTDVLTRLDSTPQTRIDELLPHNWAPVAT